MMEYFVVKSILDALARIEEKLSAIFTQGEHNMATLEQLVDAVEAVSGKVESMRVFILGLEQQLADLLQGVVVPPAVQAKIDAMFDKAVAQSQAIADAIDSDPNTPPAA